MAKLYWRIKQKNGKWTYIPATFKNTDILQDPEYIDYMEEEE